METRTLSEIQSELDAATERRAELWKELSAGHDPEKAAEVERLTERIEALWDESRAARTRARFGEPGAIIARARADERLEREYAKVA
jgi:predicted  nucleic acid-binding Zn-ribbon protein